MSNKEKDKAPNTEESKDNRKIKEADEKIDALTDGKGVDGVKPADPDQVKEAVADLALQKEAEERAIGVGGPSPDTEGKFGDVHNPRAGEGADADKVAPAAPLKVELVGEDGEQLNLGDGGLKFLDGDEERFSYGDSFGEALSNDEVIRRQQSADFDEDSSDIEGDGFTVHAPVPSEKIPFEPEEDVRAVKHGSHSAAMTGLQTDASGTYVPPGMANQGATFTQ